MNEKKKPKEPGGGDIVLRCGSCWPALEKLADGSVDAIISDPPYGTTDCPWDRAVDWSRFWDVAQRKL